MKVATHDGVFHADEVFAVAILKLISDIEIIRTRDIEKLKKADMRIDVGRKYNPKTNDYDHHQQEFKLKRNNIPYASAGLIWKHFGNKLTKSKEAFEYIDEKIIMPIDAVDNGMDYFKITKNINPYTLSTLIDSFNPLWEEENPDYDLAFLEAVELSMKILKKEIALANSLEKANKLIKEALIKAEKDNKEYLVLNPLTPPWKKLIINEKIKFVVYLYKKDEWCVHSVPIKEGSFENRKLFPEPWADLTDEKLAHATGVKDAFFCHKSRFIVCCKTKQGAINIAEIAVKN